MHVLLSEWRSNFGHFLSGLGVTLELTGVSLAIALLLGFIMALARLSGVRPLELVTTWVVEIIRAIPVLILLFIAYFSLGSVGIKMSSFVSAVVALGVFYATLYAEIFRGGILAVDRGQREAAQALGLPSGIIMQKIILPQAFFNILPPATNQLSNLIKDTSLAFTIGVAELMFQANNAGATDFRFFDDFLLAALMYFVFYLILSKLLARWELNVQQHRS